jgi:hypothetical protein
MHIESDVKMSLLYPKAFLVFLMACIASWVVFSLLIYGLWKIGIYLGGMIYG